MVDVLVADQALLKRVAINQGGEALLGLETDVLWLTYEYNKFIEITRRNNFLPERSIRMSFLKGMGQLAGKLPGKY